MRDDVAIPSPQGWLNVCDGIFHNARRRPLHPAIVERGRTITYADLAALVAKTSGHLDSMGVRPGDIVGVALGDDADHIVALLAVAWLGAVILPMDVRWTADEKRRIAVHFGARLVLVPDGGERISTIETVICDETWRRSVGAHDGMGAFVRRREQPLLLSLSSGTTGMPKGPLVTHGHTLHRLFIYTISLTFNEADRFMATTPLYFGGGRVFALSLCLCRCHHGAAAAAVPARGTDRDGAPSSSPHHHDVHRADDAAPSDGNAGPRAHRCSEGCAMSSPAAPRRCGRRNGSRGTAESLAEFDQLLQLVGRRRRLAAAARAWRRGRESRSGGRSS